MSPETFEYRPNDSADDAVLFVGGGLDGDGSVGDRLATELGVTVRSEVDSSKALQRLATSERPDCIVVVTVDDLDARLAFVSAVRETDSTVPIIALVTPDDESVNAALATGATDVVTLGHPSAWERLLVRRVESALAAQSSSSSSRVLRDRLRHLQALSEFGREVLSVCDLDRLFDRAVRVVAETLGVETVGVFELAETGEVLLLRAGVGWDEELVGEATIPLTVATPSGRAVESRSPFVVGSFDQNDPVDGPTTRPATDPAWGVAVVIEGADGVWGTLEVASARERALRDDEVSFVRTIVETVTTVIERSAREFDAERTLDRVTDGVFALDDAVRVTYANDHAETLVGEQTDSLLGSVLFDALPSAVGARFEDRYRRARASGDPVRFEAYDPSRSAWFEFHLYPSQTGMSVVFRDITERKTDELALSAIYDATQALYRTEEEGGVCELLESTVTSVLSDAWVAVYLFDDAANLLRPVTSSSSLTARHGELSAIGSQDDSVAWRAFVTGTPVVQDSSSVDDDAETTASSTSVIAVPVGDHGVFCVVSPTSDAVTDRTRQVTTALARGAAAAFDRIRRENTLREREREIEQQTDQLDRFSQLTQTLLGVGKAITHADTRAELESAVCAELVTSSRIQFAWIGSVDQRRSALVPRAWAGTERGYLDGVSLAIPSENSDPAVEAATRRERVHVPNVSNGLRDEPWRQEMLTRGYQSVLSVPLVHGDTMYGVLTACADERDAFDDLSEAVFEAIAASTVYAIDALEKRRTLRSDSVVELDVLIRDAPDVLSELVRALDCRAEFDGYVSTRSGSSLLFVTVSDAAPAAVTEVLDESTRVESVTHLSTDDERSRFELTITGETIVDDVGRLGGVVHRLVVDPTEMRLTVELPQPSDVRQFIEALRDDYPEVRLAGRRTLDRPIRSRRSFLSDVEAALTARQLEVLRTAYFAGYFEWPRTSSGEEVAALLGITQPTFNNHLRVAERKFFSILFDES